MPARTNHCRLSVLLITYNHQKYIQQALLSIFSQKIDGPIELVIADDASTDSTLDQIKTHEGKDPRFLFKFLDKTSNLGVTRNYQRGFAACSGEYVAILEGDDYWAHTSKLQRQCDFLDAHLECDLCSVNYFVYEEDQSQYRIRTAVGPGHRYIGARDLIVDNLVGNFSTCMYRKSALDALPPGLFEIKSYDWIVNICVARRSLIGFLEEPMSVYRLHLGGVWSKTAPMKKLQTQLELIPPYDALTGHVFHTEFESLAHRLRNAISLPSIEPAADAASNPAPVAPTNWTDYLPHLVKIVFRGIIPPAFARMLAKAFQGNNHLL